MDNFTNRYKNAHIILSPVLFSHPTLLDLSADSLMLYGMTLSIQETGGVLLDDKKWIQISQKEIAYVFRCGKDRARRMFYELKNKGLLETKKYADGHSMVHVLQPPIGSPETDM